MSRVAVVTGSNQGIGLAIVKALSKQFDGVTYLTARNLEAGQKALEELKKDNFNNVFFHQLDITDKKSIATLKSYLESKYGGIDILVNNAAIATREGTFGDQAEVVLKTNYFSLLDVCDLLFPLLRSHARVVNVASRIGSCYIGNVSEEKRNQLLACATVEQVTSQMQQFIDHAKADTHEKHGWAHNTYGASKAGVILVTRIQQADIDKDTSRRDIVINVCCPGHCATKINKYSGALSPEEGAITPVYCALLPANLSSPRGEFLFEKVVRPVTFLSDSELIKRKFVRPTASKF